ncbi:MAG: hypothetical protein VR67_11720 [Peptococcaceae bacterium BRH_c8a]|nr:MAG: hypothetical protein VR67_11720 [Peptococcaceae bacterium BRH_c8a]
MKKVPFLFIALFILLLIILLTNLKNPTNQLVNFKNYYIKNFSLKINLPETTSTNEDYFSGSEIIFNCYLQDKSLNFNGYIQVWNINDLNKFLEVSKNNSEFDFKLYNKEMITINSYNGFKVDWTALFANHSYTSGVEYFITKKNSNMVLRVSLFVNQKDFPKQLEHTLNTIINSIIWD